MSTSNVRSIESLEAFHTELLRLAGDWDGSLQEIRVLVGRIDHHFSHERPAYWRRQLQLAERACDEAQENLSRTRAAARPADRPPAGAAVQRLRRAEQRQRQCEAKLRLAKSVALEIARACDELLGPLAELNEHCEGVLPTAARQLTTLIEHLRTYAGPPKSTPP